MNSSIIHSVLWNVLLLKSLISKSATLTVQGVGFYYNIVVGIDWHFPRINQKHHTVTVVWTGREGISSGEL